MADLLPCPWCGGSIHRPTTNDVQSVGPKTWWVRFYHDGAVCIGRLSFQVRAIAKTKEEAIPIAIKAWNRRAAPVQPAGLRELLKDAMQLLHGVGMWKHQDIEDQWRMSYKEVADRYAALAHAEPHREGDKP